jgi:hypothetical protein
MNKFLLENRKLKAWDFSTRFIIKKRVIDTFYINDNYNQID